MEPLHIDFTPEPHIIASIQNTKISYAEALSELIDNSFDAGANRVTLEIEPNCVLARDDGAGCSDLSAMLALGKHRKRETTRLGRYGVGAKSAMIGLGKLAHITSRHGGIERRVIIDWDSVSGWGIDGESEATCLPPGTEVRISNLIKTRPSNLDALRKTLAFTFSPALESGRTIHLMVGGKCTELEPYALPPFDEIIEDERSLNGLGFSVCGGILKEPHRNPRKPFIIAYEHRVIFETDEPCGEFNSSPRFLAWVDLYGTWPLLKHKDGLTDQGEWLARELNEIFSDMLERLTQEGEAIELREVAAELEAEFNEIVGRECRSKGDSEGTIEPRNSPKRRRTAARVSPSGVALQRQAGRKPTGFSFVLAELEKVIGRVDHNSRRIQITLNTNHAAVCAWRKNRDQMLLKFAAVSLLASHVSSGEMDPRQFKMASILGSDSHQTHVNVLSTWCEQLVLKSKQQQASESA